MQSPGEEKDAYETLSDFPIDPLYTPAEVVTLTVQEHGYKHAALLFFPVDRFKIDGFVKSQKAHDLAQLP